MIDWVVSSPRVFDAPGRLTEVTSWHTHVPFAFWCIDALRPRLFVELGTHRGDSYSAFCQAVDRLGLPTRCYAVDTWRGDPQAGEYGEEIFEEFRAYHDQHFAGFSRMVRTTFDDAATHFEEGSIDLLHIDGLHTYEAVRHDLETWASRLGPASVVLFHDVNVREAGFGAWKLWEELSRERPSFTFHHGHGLGVLLWGPAAPEPARRLAASSPEEAAEIRRVFERLGEGAAALARIPVLERELRRREELRQAAVRDREQLAEEFRAARAQADAQLLRFERSLQALQGSLQEGLAVQRAEQQALRGAIDDVRTEMRKGLSQQLGRLLGRIGHTVAVLFQLLYWTATFQLRAGLRLRKDARTIRRTRLFDPAHYLVQVGSDRGAHRDPLAHFLRKGAAAGLDPNPFFDTSWYVEHNPEVARSGENPLIHYIRVGAGEGRATSVGFDTAFYLSSNAEVARSGMNPLAHYLHFGMARGLRCLPAER